MALNRVVITGTGIWSCLGYSLEEVAASLRSGKSGIGIDPARTEMGFRSPLTGILNRPSLKGLLDRRARVMLAEEAEYAYMSTLEAIRQAGLDEDFFTKNEAGILFGNDSSAEPVISSMDVLREKKDTTLIGSGSIFQSMNSTVTMNLATIFKLRGINFTISGACASGSHAIGLGFLLIRQGLQNCVICGGAQEVNPASMCSFDGLSAFSVRTENPSSASRPFDKDRDGLVPSGGAATVILESLESAQKRGAKILGEVIGYGFSSNGEHISQPSVDGPVRALEMSLREAGLSAKAIQYINAHATSTPVGDASEALAIDQVFGSSRPWVSSTKSMTGHECWMAGASEIVYSLLMMQHNFIAPNINFENPDEASQKLKIPTKAVEANIDVFLSNSFGFGGTNSSLIVQKFKG